MHKRTLPSVVAVYGSLRRNDYANGIMEGATFVGQDALKGALFDLGAYPGLLMGDNKKGDVVVDLYKLPEGEKGKELISRLDAYEAYSPESPDSSLYLRKVAVTINGETPVWAYEYNREPPEESLVKSGDWHNRSNEDG